MLSRVDLSEQAIVLAYDITNLETFHNLEDWLRVARQATEEVGRPMPMVVLAGNKSACLCATTKRTDSWLGDFDAAGPILSSIPCGAVVD